MFNSLTSPFVLMWIKTIWESDTSTRKHIQDSQEVSPFHAGDKKSNDVKKKAKIRNLHNQVLQLTLETPHGKVAKTQENIACKRAMG